MGVLCAMYPRCQDLTLLAIKGGAACDCEINFIVALMAELGAEVQEMAKSKDGGERIEWVWCMVAAPS